MIDQATKPENGAGAEPSPTTARAPGTKPHRKTQSRRTQPTTNKTPRHQEPQEDRRPPNPGRARARLVAVHRYPLPRTKPILTSSWGCQGWSEAESRSDAEGALYIANSTSNTQRRGRGRPVKTRVRHRDPTPPRAETDAPPESR